MKLQSRLALAVAASAAFAIFLSAATFWVLASQTQRAAFDDGLVSAAEEPREVLEDLRGVQRARGFGGVLEQRPGDERVFTRLRITDAQGAVIFDDGLPEVALAGEPRLQTIEIDGERWRMAAAQTGPNGRITVQVARNVEDVEAGLSRLRSRILLWSLLGVAVAGGLGALVAQRLTAPITAVSAAAKSMALRQDLPSRIDVDRSDEIGELATSFNQMLAALETSRDQQRRLVADASHELRTPLTSLRLKIDLLDSTPDLPAAQRQELLNGSASELQRLSDLVAELVSLASDPTDLEEEPVPTSLAMLANDVAASAQQRDAREITVEVLADTSIDLRPNMVRRSIANIVGNAVKYSATGQPIRVIVDRASIEVHDRGEGIAEADLPHVFDRFFRSPTARTRPGNGIGLAIVARVAELHGGTTWARNADGGGAIVGFSLAPDGK